VRPVVVLVEFLVKAAFRKRFRELIGANARASLECERGCRRFDVLVDPTNRDGSCSTRFTMMTPPSTNIFAPATIGVSLRRQRTRLSIDRSAVLRFPTRWERSFSQTRKRRPWKCQSNRLLKNSLRFRKEGVRRGFFRPDLVHRAEISWDWDHCFPFFQAAGHTSPAGVKSLGRRTML